jgi:hypothetical protein
MILGDSSSLSKDQVQGAAVHVFHENVDFAITKEKKKQFLDIFP